MLPLDKLFINFSPRYARVGKSREFCSSLLLYFSDIQFGSFAFNLHFTLWCQRFQYIACINLNQDSIKLGRSKCWK